jgi:hypothetical protein
MITLPTPPTEPEYDGSSIDWTKQGSITGSLAMSFVTAGTKFFY